MTRYITETNIWQEITAAFLHPVVFFSWAFNWNFILFTCFASVLV